MKPKLLVLENHHEQDIPEELMEILKESDWVKKYQVELWTSFYEAYYPENRKTTIKRLSACENFICAHVFVSWMQMEIFIEILHNFKQQGNKINFWLLNPVAKERFQKWYEKHEADSTPDTKKYNDSPDLREEFKNNLNKQFLEVLDFHNIYGVESSYAISEEKPIKATDIKK